MKFIYFIIVLLICVSLTACNIGSAEQTAEPQVSAQDDSDKETIRPDVDASKKDIEITPEESTINDSQINGSETEIDLRSYFDGLSGTAIFLDQSGNYKIYNKADSDIRVSPCSTFKIISTLAAFEYDVVTPSQSVIAWDGTKWPFESWNKDLNITEAFQSSCVWYYRKLTDQIGQDNMSDFINMLGYGNCDISQWEGSGLNKNPLIDGFWLESSLLISPREQVDMMYRIFEGETGIDQNTIAELKKIMYKKDTDSGIKIYGKTGSGNGGWFVGFFELSGEITYCAVYLSEKQGVYGPKAQEITYNIVQGYF